MYQAGGTANGDLAWLLLAGRHRSVGFRPASRREETQARLAQRIGVPGHARRGARRDTRLARRSPDRARLMKRAGMGGSSAFPLIHPSPRPLLQADRIAQRRYAGAELSPRPLLASRAPGCVAIARGSILVSHASYRPSGQLSDWLLPRTLARRHNCRRRADINFAVRTVS